MTWKAVEESADRDRLAAAKLQHEVSRLVRRGLERRGWSVTRYAEVTDQGYRRALAMLNGDALMRLEDVAAAERVLGVRLLDVIVEAD